MSTAALNNPSQLATNPNITPNVKGMGLKDAIYLLENKGFMTVVYGKGKIVSQSIEAGTNFKKGQKIILMLN
jgi:cell division protein FtsI (penicillin-binding protein 3)